MPSDVEILEWMKENYPEYADNLELGRKLYDRMVLGKKRGGIVKIADLELDQWATIKGIVIDVYDPVEYEGCPICKRSVAKGGCEHLDSGEAEPVMLKIHKFVVTDGTGEVYCTASPTTLDELVHIGDEVQMRGRLRQGYRDKLEFAVWKDVEIVKEAPRVKRISQKAYSLLLDLKGMGKLKKSLFETMLKNLGEEFETVEPYLIDKGDEYYYPNVEAIDGIEF